jgi:SecD/SecF fusion protein
MRVSRQAVVHGILVIAVLAGLAGCGDSEPVRRDACGAKVAAAKNAVRLTYRGDGDIAADVPLLCGRLRALKLGSRALSVSRGRIVIVVARKDIAAVAAVTRTGRLGFYDWEANVIGPSGKPAPDDPDVTGGAGAGSAGSLGYYDAVLRASKPPSDVEGRGSRYYAVDPRSRKVFGSGAATRAQALAPVPAGERGRAKVRVIKSGTLLLRGEQLPPVQDPALGPYFVLRDRVALRGAGIRDPQQRFDQGPGGSGAPIVTFEFSARGAAAFQKLTRTLARRGSERTVPSGQSADANQHFAIVVDDRIVSVPYIDFRHNPDGIDGAGGSQISGGFTIASARQLASVLSAGPLPVALELVATTPR